MRVAYQTAFDAVPSSSGRQEWQAGFRWPRTQWRALPRELASHQASRPVALAGSFALNFGDTAATANSVEEAIPPKEQEVPRWPAVEPSQQLRDTLGRSMAGRKKPLKINLDLALVSSGGWTYYLVVGMVAVPYVYLVIWRGLVGGSQSLFPSAPFPPPSHSTMETSDAMQQHAPLLPAVPCTPD
jgi:hypothetical protein